MRRTHTPVIAATLLLLGLIAFPMPDALAEAPQCNDAIDNDGDIAVDYPEDPGCATPDDNTEMSDQPDSSPQCNDNVDNDADGAMDYPDDSDCESYVDNLEEPAPECSDGLDNDGDGNVDYPDDSGCWGEGDDGEVGHDPECRDGFDNDGDGASDFPKDPDCSNVDDNSEGQGTPPTECGDLIDNDGDGWTDYPKEAGCSSAYDETEVMEAPECADGADNDGDGSTDHPEDSGCSGPDDRDEDDVHEDPNCAFNGTSCDGMVLTKPEPRVLFVAVGDSDRCMYRRLIRLKRLRPGPDLVVARFRTDGEGESYRDRPRRAGTYRAVASKVELEDLTCSWRRSNTIRLR